MKDQTQPLKTAHVGESRQLDEQAGKPVQRLPRWLSKFLLIVIVAAITSGFILALLVIVGQIVRPGAVGLQAALSLSGSVFVLSLVVVGWKVLRSGIGGRNAADESSTAASHADRDRQVADGPGGEPNGDSRN